MVNQIIQALASFLSRRCQASCVAQRDICSQSGHTRAEVQGYFEDAGFVDVEVTEFVSGTLARCVGRKP